MSTYDKTGDERKPCCEDRCINAAIDAIFFNHYKIENTIKAISGKHDAGEQGGSFFIQCVEHGESTK